MRAVAVGRAALRNKRTVECLRRDRVSIAEVIIERRRLLRTRGRRLDGIRVHAGGSRSGIAKILNAEVRKVRGAHVSAGCVRARKSSEDYGGTSKSWSEILETFAETTLLQVVH
jgi:hypothetical protein